MFCTKCGTKAIDGAAFCQMCGAKLIQDNRKEQETAPVPMQDSAKKPILSSNTASESGQKIVKEEEDVFEREPVSSYESLPQKVDETIVSKENESVSKSLEEIYEILEKEVVKCRGIKSAKSWKQGISIAGKTHLYYVNITNMTAKFTSKLSAEFSIINWVEYFLFVWIIRALVLMALSQHLYFPFGDYVLVLLASIICGFLIAIEPYIGRKEKDSVKECVRKIVEPEGISLTTNELQPGIRFVISGVLVSIGMLVMLGAVLENI